MNDSDPRTKNLLQKGLVKTIIELAFEVEAWVAKKWASSAHQRLFYAQWGLKPVPEWFDHSIDYYYQWPKTNNSLWLERGVFNSVGLSGGRLLELTCGDGFNTKYFYSIKSKEIIACDFDRNALKAAKRKNSASNIKYVWSDIRKNMPEGAFENIIWDFGFSWAEFFNEEEVATIVANVKERLAKDGVFSGYLMPFGSTKYSQDQSQSPIQFQVIGELKSYLSRYFANVKVIETIYPSRRNLYFWASDSEIPFSENWKHSV